MTKATCFYSYANFHENFKDDLKVKYYKVNRESTLYIKKVLFARITQCKYGKNVTN
jgi:hypothetical protein